MRKLDNYEPTKFMAEDSHYDERRADYAVEAQDHLASLESSLQAMVWLDSLLRKESTVSSFFQRLFRFSNLSLLLQHSFVAPRFFRGAYLR